MIHDMKHESTLIIDYNDEKIAVSTLPKQIQNEIATLDRINQEKIDALYELEKLQLAYQSKKIHINQLLEKIFTKEEVVNNDDSKKEKKEKKDKKVVVEPLNG